MISLRKLSTLPRGTRIRKIARIVRELEEQRRLGGVVDEGYLLGVLRELESTFRRSASQPDARPSEGVSERIALLKAIGELRGKPGDLRLLNRVRHTLLICLGEEQADWDLLDTIGGQEPPGRELTIFPIALCLEELRSPFNLGSIARSAEAFGAAGVLLAGATAVPEHRRARRAAMGTLEALPVRQVAPPWRHGEVDAAAGPGGDGGEAAARTVDGGAASTANGDAAALPPTQPTHAREEGPAIFALEGGGKPINEFVFPPTGICLLGSEELGLSPGALETAEGSWGRCSIPLHGFKGSLNVGVAAGILLAAWTAALESGSPVDKKGALAERERLLDGIVESLERGIRG